MKIDPLVVQDAIKKKKLIPHSEEIEYSCFREKFKSIPRGTVLIKNRAIPGFQRIKRIFTLEKGLENNMNAEFVWAEEKIDGFNVRIAIVDGKLFAFSRGGFVDPFATEKAREMKFERFFKEHPEYVICGEMIGNTPYTKPTKEFDVKFFVFDIMNENGECIDQEKKYSVIKRFNLDAVPVFGRFSIKNQNDIKKLKVCFLEVNKKGKEGIVMKSDDRKEIVKYVVPNADIEDIAHASHMLFDMPLGFINQRLLRSSLFIKDFGLNKKEYSQKLGNAFYEKMFESLEKFEKEGGVYDEFEILIKDLKIWDGIKNHMSKEVKIALVSKKQEKGKTRIRFKKIYKESSHNIRHAIEGGSVED